MQKQNESGQLPDSVKGVPVTGNALFCVFRSWRSVLKRKMPAALVFVKGIGIAVLFLCSPAYSGDLLQEVSTLAKSGAPGLALQVLDRHQPDPHLKMKEWVQWEHKRIDLYAQQNNWDAAINRLVLLQQQYTNGGLPELSETFLRWMQEKQAIAYININQGKQALAVLRELIWKGNQYQNQDYDRENFSRWRRLVIKAYLASKLIDDAYTAMLRYQQDYQNSDREWNLLRANVMLYVDRADEASRLLSQDISPAARALYYLANLDNHKTSPSKTYKKSSVLAKRKATPLPVSRQLWAVAAKAARQEGNWSSEIESLSRALVLEGVAPEGLDVYGNLLFAVTGKQLWASYLNYGKEIGNEAHLLLGNDKEWMQAASGWLKKKMPQKAEALLAVLAVQSRDTEIQKQAHEKFTRLLLGRALPSKKELGKEGGILLIRHLYLEEQSYVSDVDLPIETRYQLIDYALSHSDIPLASRLMGEQVAPPEGVDALLWELHRARILVMGGKHDKGVQVLHAILENSSDMSDEQLDRYVQVLFDLQAIAAHKEAITLFELLPVNRESQRYREVLFWMADSNRALEHYKEAARQYLQSAIVLGENNMDPWAQTARYQAADMLAKAGIREDARRIYKRLLKVTKEPARRAVIQNRIQQLWLTPVKVLEEESVSKPEAESVTISKPESVLAQP